MLMVNVIINCGNCATRLTYHEVNGYVVNSGDRLLTLYEKTEKTTKKVLAEFNVDNIVGYEVFIEKGERREVK